MLLKNGTKWNDIYFFYIKQVHDSKPTTIPKNKERYKAANSYLIPEFMTIQNKVLCKSKVDVIALKHTPLNILA